MAHARFAPSSAQRVIDCPASLTLNETEPDRAGIDAAHGTAAHFIGELCLSKRCATEKYLGCIVGVLSDGETYFVHEKAPAPAEGAGWAFEVDDEMAVAVQEYVDWCEALPGDHYVERRVNISRYCPEPDQFGTADHIAVHGREMWVTDLKYGKGVMVHAEDNPQAILYALGALDEYDPFGEIEEIHVRICQPRLGHKDVWSTTRENLEKWGAHIKERFTLALTPNPPFGPTGKACRFCKVAARCRALADHLSHQRALAFDDLTEEFVVEDPRLLSDEELAAAWRLAKMMEARQKAIAKEMIRLMMQGVELPTVYLAEKKTHRKFRNPDHAAAFLLLDCDLDRKQVFEEKMVSPNKAMKLLPKEMKEKLAEGFVEKPRGGPCIVEASSKQPRYEPNGDLDIDSAFDDLEDEAYEE